MGQIRNAYKVLVGKPEGKRPLERQRHRWEDSIRRNLTEIGWEGVDWIHLVQDRDLWRIIVDIIKSLRVENFLTC
jgi:hypothetical protein